MSKIIKLIPMKKAIKRFFTFESIPLLWVHHDPQPQSLTNFEVSETNPNTVYEFTDKNGNFFPSSSIKPAEPEKPKAKRSTKGKKKAKSSSGSNDSTPKAILERAFSSREGFIEVAKSLDIPTLSDPAFLASTSRPWATFEELFKAYSRSLETIADNVIGKRDIPLPRLPNGIHEFDAQSRWDEFQYLRFCHKIGVFDYPMLTLSVEDVDRLFTCGFLTEDDFDFDLGRNLLAYGAFARAIRQTGKASRKNPSIIQPQWTIFATRPRSTAKVILDKVVEFERQRQELDMATQHPFHYPSLLRPQWNPFFIPARQVKFGKWGLEGLGISDERAERLIRKRDPSFVAPDDYDQAKYYDIPKLREPSRDEQFRFDELVIEQAGELTVPDIYVTDFSVDPKEPEPPSVPVFHHYKNKPATDGRKVIALPDLKRKPSYGLKRHKTTVLDIETQRKKFITNKPKPLEKPDFLPLPRKCSTMIERYNEFESHWYEKKPLLEKVRIDSSITTAPAVTSSEPIREPLFVNGKFVDLEYETAMTNPRKRKRGSESSSDGRTQDGNPRPSKRLCAEEVWPAYRTKPSRKVNPDGKSVTALAIGEVLPTQKPDKPFASGPAPTPSPMPTSSTATTRRHVKTSSSSVRMDTST